MIAIPKQTLPRTSFRSLLALKSLSGFAPLP